MTFLLAAYAAIWLLFIGYFAVFMMKTARLRSRLDEAKRPGDGR
ncbi:MAG: CcmD family protein [Nitrospinota bacterium]|nr:CcmD family protein [Nitrospinota bacterium]